AVFPMPPEELEVLYDLTCLRLITSLVHAAMRREKDPDNTYWQVSAAPAEALLRRLHALDRSLLLCYFRSACGLEPSPQSHALREWLVAHRHEFRPIVGIDLTGERVTIFDWSVRSPDLGGLD